MLVVMSFTRSTFMKNYKSVIKINLQITFEYSEKNPEITLLKC